MQLPIFTDVLAARDVIRPYLLRTPSLRYPLLDKLLDAKVYVKHENHLPTGAFKVRGGIHLVSQLDDETKRRGVLAVSSGNHGQSIAYASHLFGVKATVVMFGIPNPIKREAIESWGAHVIAHGKNSGEARIFGEHLTAEHGYRNISACDEPELIAGVGTCTVEVIEDVPDVDMIFVPIGGGSSASGACLAVEGMKPSVEVIGVGAKRAPASYLTWKHLARTEAEVEPTIAEGLAVNEPFMLPQQILWERLNDFLMVDDQQLQNAVRHFLEKVRTLVEPAGAAALAGALSIPDRVRGKTIVLIASGANISPEHLKRCLE
ncbi:MAG: threonine/serine dehydratase [Planctomycetota bacterium]|nr:threonine/serine dehydratase [Planctomycetota bacterium]MDA1213622.1 threonine/serine dehydratase [Planctomycetota bacterium]